MNTSKSILVCFHGNSAYTCPLGMVTDGVCVCCNHCHRDCPDVRMDEMKPFTVPGWMVEKMKRAMEGQRDADL